MDGVSLLLAPMVGDTPPPPCFKLPTAVACTIKAPTDPEFASICNPGTVGHAGGAEVPQNRCSGLYTKGSFRCACCGNPLFQAKAKFLPAGDGWPAFHGNSTVGSNVCTPGGTEVVCSKCGSHLGDYFASGTVEPFEYYCIDGVCLLPPGAADGAVCTPNITDAESDDIQTAATGLTRRALMRERATSGA